MKLSKASCTKCGAHSHTVIARVCAACRVAK